MSRKRRRFRKGRVFKQQAPASSNSGSKSDSSQSQSSQSVSEGTSS
jgi:hypothetical protein